jgi:hypothetical protein
MAPKSKQPANGKSDSKPKTTSPAAVAVAAANAEASEAANKLTQTTVTKPDTAAYQAEQDALKKEIEQYQAKLVCFLLVAHAEWSSNAFWVG